MIIDIERFLIRIQYIFSRQKNCSIFLICYIIPLALFNLLASVIFSVHRSERCTWCNDINQKKFDWNGSQWSTSTCGKLTCSQHLVIPRRSTRTLPPIKSTLNMEYHSAITVCCPVRREKKSLFCPDETSFSDVGAESATKAPLSPLGLSDMTQAEQGRWCLAKTGSPACCCEASIATAREQIWGFTLIITHDKKKTENPHFREEYEIHPTLSFVSCWGLVRQFETNSASCRCIIHSPTLEMLYPW